MEFLLWSMLNIAGLTTLFCGMDSIFTKFGFEGVYYLLHSIHNGAIVYYTWPDVALALTDFSKAGSIDPNYPALELVFALHIYHIVYYWRKFRFDDWLHHVLMVGIALPIGGLLRSGALLGYSLFFTTGLPGGLDYGMLFLVRNGLMARETEKKANAWLSTWIRSPGCSSHAALTLAFLSMSGMVQWSPFWCGAILTAALNYWNGQYFAAQVIYNAGQLHLWEKPTPRPVLHAL